MYNNFYSEPTSTNSLLDVERLGDGYQCELCNYKGASLCKLKLHNSRTHETEEEGIFFIFYK